MAVRCSNSILALQVARRIEKSRPLVQRNPRESKTSGGVMHVIALAKRRPIPTYRFGVLALGEPNIREASNFVPIMYLISENILKLEIFFSMPEIQLNTA